MADHDIAAVVAQADLPAIASHYANVTKKGHEFVARCVFHSPDNHPSLTFFNKGGKWQFKCFTCGEGGDALDWIEKLEGLETVEALKRLNGGTVWEPKFSQSAPRRAPAPDRITSKPPAGVPDPDFTLRDLGSPTLIYRILDLDGSLIAFECRYQAGERKEIRIWSWGSRGTQSSRWAAGHLNVPRPLYGLQRLTEKPDAPVLLTEGPKKADAGAELLPQYASLSWTGGANGWSRHNWQPLAGRSVLIWPDADQPGADSAEKIAALLSDQAGLACKVKVVYPTEQPEGWDLADAQADGWDTDRVVAWAKPRAKEWARPEPAVYPPTDDLPPVEAYAEEEGEEDQLPASMSEDMLAERFVEQHAPNWRYVRQWGSWYEWRGDGWYLDETAKIDHLAVLLTRQAIYWPQGTSLTPDGKRRVNSRRTAGAVRDIALSHPRIAAKIGQWDTNPWLLGVPGGVVDLRSGELAKARPEDYITKRTACAPSQGAAPMWAKFLETVTDGNERLISFLQAFAGYALTGETREQCLAFLYGTGQNGKGVFITTLARVLGDYAVTADADVFMESDHQRHSTEMARLRGARLVTVDETDSSKRWNEKRIKRITGGGKIEARFMRQDDFEFVPQFKLLIAGNHKPQLRGVGKAIQRRIHLVPFTVTIADSERDNKLAERLEAEYPQILAWMIDGCRHWQASSLEPPAEVVDATTQYIEGEDTIGEWLEERTEQRGEVSRPVAYKNYRGWMEGRGERPWSTKAFWAALEERGYTMKKSMGSRFIRGLALKVGDSDEPPPPSYYDR